MSNLTARQERRDFWRQQRLRTLQMAAGGHGVSIGGMTLAKWLLDRQWTVFTNDEIWPACDYGWDGVREELFEAGYIRPHKTVADMWVVRS